MHLSALPKLFRRRQVCLPTWWGGLLLLVVALALAAGLVLNAYALLAPSQPARGLAGTGARTLVVEGWLDQGELRQAMAVLRTGRYERVLTTGGPIKSWSEDAQWHDFAARAASYLRKNGVAVPVISVPAPESAQDRSYLSAVMVRDWAQQSGVSLDAIDLFSAGVHARRSWLVFRMALGDPVEVGVIAAQPTEYDARRWWTSSSGAKNTMGEVLSLAWTKCCFWPAARGSHEERWAVPAAAPRRP